VAEGILAARPCSLPVAPVAYKAGPSLHPHWTESFLRTTIATAELVSPRLLVDGRRSPHLSYPSLESSAPRVVTVRPQPRGNRAHRDRRHPVPSRELTNTIPAPFPTSNRCVVSPWSPPRPFPDHPRRRLAGFWPKPPPVTPGDPIASPPLIPGS
jgi:hypothetical protein